MSSKEQPSVKEDAAAKRRAARSAEGSSEQPARRPHPATLSHRAAADFGSLTQRDVLHLQRTVGNRAVGTLLTGAGRVELLQPKLSVAPAGDSYEQAADRTARLVMRQLHARPPEQPGQIGSKPRQVSDEQAGEMVRLRPLIQHRTGAEETAVPPEVEDSIRSLRGGGRPLPERVREPMEQAFGADFREVRVHTDERADSSNRAIRAKAFTTAQDIFFRSGEFNPDSPGGQELIAHELTHVVQQKPSVMSAGSSMRRSTSAEEPPALHPPTPAGHVTKGILQLTYNFDEMPLEEHEQAVRSALSLAKSIIDNALQMLARAGEEGEEADLFAEWFGESDVSAVRDKYTNARGWLDSDLSFNDVGDPSSFESSNDTTYAATFHNNPKINLFPFFFTVGPREQALTFVHEMTHVADDTEDFNVTAARPHSAKELSDEEKANCAYNYEFFAGAALNLAAEQARRRREEEASEAERSEEEGSDADVAEASEAVDWVFIAEFLDASRKVKQMIDLAQSYQTAISHYSKRRRLERIRAAEGYLFRAFERDSRIGHYFHVTQVPERLVDLDRDEIDDQIIDDAKTGWRPVNDETLEQLYQELQEL